MALATLNIKLPPRRIVSEREAAGYCGLQVKYFKTDCPVKPVALPRGKTAYDMQDLDRWLDTLKSGNHEDDEILSRLG